MHLQLCLFELFKQTLECPGLIFNQLVLNRRTSCCSCRLSFGFRKPRVSLLVFYLYLLFWWRRQKMIAHAEARLPRLYPRQSTAFFFLSLTEVWVSKQLAQEELSVFQICVAERNWRPFGDWAHVPVAVPICIGYLWSIRFGLICIDQV